MNNMIVFGGLCPHPAVVIPGIDLDNYQNCTQTQLGIYRFAEKLRDSQPDELVIITPHGANPYDEYGPLFTNAFGIYALDSYHGDFSVFNHKEIQVSARGSIELPENIVTTAQNLSPPVPVIKLDKESFVRYQLITKLNYGCTVPLYYFRQTGLDIPITIVCAASRLPYSYGFDLGKCLRIAIENQNKKIAVVASADLANQADLSLPLDFQTPQWAFEREILSMLVEGEDKEILDFESNYPDLISDARQEVYEPLLVLLGAFSGYQTHRELISYERPFGVGYAAVAISPTM